MLIGVIKVYKVFSKFTHKSKLKEREVLSYGAVFYICTVMEKENMQMGKYGEANRWTHMKEGGPSYMPLPLLLHVTLLINWFVFI
jgi:hypothetical protein